MKVHMMIVRNRPGDKQQLSRATFQFSDTTLRIKILGGCVQETRNHFSAMHMSIDQCQEQNNEVVKGLGGAVETTHTNGWLSLKVAHSGQLLLYSLAPEAHEGVDYPYASHCLNAFEYIYPKGSGGAVEMTHINGWLSLKVAHSRQLLLQSSTRSS